MVADERQKALEALTELALEAAGPGDYTIKQYGQPVSLTWSEDGSILWQQEGDYGLALHPLWVKELAKESSLYRDALALRPCSKSS